MARDRVGIIADVTGAIRELGGNLADLSQTVLGGYFTMILVGSFPDGVTAEGLRERLRQLDPADPFEVGVKPRLEAPAPAPAGLAKYVLTAVGPDKIGCWWPRCPGTCATRRSILKTWPRGVDGERYWMTLLVNLPAGTEVGTFKSHLKQAMAAAGILAELQHESIFRATNEV